MPTRTISLTPEQDSFLDEVLQAGEYRTASEAIDDAIHALQQRRVENARKRDRLRAEIAAGVAALERGDYTEVEDAELDVYLDNLADSANG
jgi:antitoxin ParD1/3/4